MAPALPKSFNIVRRNETADHQIHGTGLEADEIGPIIAVPVALAIAVVILLCLVKHKRGKMQMGQSKDDSDGFFYKPIWRFLDCGTPAGAAGGARIESAEEKAARLEREVEVMKAERKKAKRATLDDEQRDQAKRMSLNGSQSNRMSAMSLNGSQINRMSLNGDSTVKPKRATVEEEHETY